jgi:hypothetical protein
MGCIISPEGANALAVVYGAWGFLAGMAAALLLWRFK